jgi:glycosyltransferase involved in cell wall biosynthesis
MTTLLNPARVADLVQLPRHGQVAGLIAAHNEEAHIFEVVREGSEHLRRWLVVADGCDDQTAKRAREAGAEVWELPHGLGKASALIRGCSHLLQDRDVGGVLMLDGDGQHAPGDIPKFLQAWRNGDEHLLVGARDLSSRSMPWPRRWTNRLMSQIIRKMAESTCIDTQCGFRLASRAFLNSKQWHATHFELETEMILQAGAGGWTTKDIPVQTIYHGNRSHIRVLPDLVRWLRLLTRESSQQMMRNAKRALA